MKNAINSEGGHKIKNPAPAGLKFRERAITILYLLQSPYPAQCEVWWADRR